MTYVLRTWHQSPGSKLIKTTNHKTLESAEQAAMIYKLSDFVGYQITQQGVTISEDWDKIGYINHTLASKTTP